MEKMFLTFQHRKDIEATEKKILQIEVETGVSTSTLVIACLQCVYKKYMDLGLTFDQFQLMMDLHMDQVNNSRLKAKALSSASDGDIPAVYFAGWLIDG